MPCLTGDLKTLEPPMDPVHGLPYKPVHGPLLRTPPTHPPLQTTPKNRRNVEVCEVVDCDEVS